jgi:serine/threonine-protein kinase
LVDALILESHERLDRRHGELARGGMAAVEIASDRSLGRRVALKVLLPELHALPLAVCSFLREAQITGQLAHPNIVPVHELGRDAEGHLYFTMDLLEGRTLFELIDELRGDRKRADARGLWLSSTLSDEQLLRVIEIFMAVLDAVTFAHARGVVHCDIKSANVMIGDHGQVHLMDWGIAKLLPAAADEPRWTRVHPDLRAVEAEQVVIGTPAYMSPEQAEGQRDRIDVRTDIFQLGAMLFEILTGHPPYQGVDADEELAQARACKALLLPHLAITRDLRRIVGIAMDPNPNERYQTVEELRADLLGFMRGGDNFPRQRFAKGELLVREGELGDAAYIIVFGRCEVFRQGMGKRESLRMLGPGDVLGETAILAASPRTASVVALTDVVAVVVTAEVLEREVAAMKPWMGSFIKALAQRFTDIESRASKASPDPIQIANLALMNLRTWGRRSSEGHHAMSVVRLCTSIAQFCGLPDNAVLKVLRQYPQFDVDLPLDRVALVDEPSLLEALRRDVWSSGGRPSTGR